MFSDLPLWKPRAQPGWLLSSLEYSGGNNYLIPCWICMFAQLQRNEQSLVISVWSLGNGTNINWSSVQDFASWDEDDQEKGGGSSRTTQEELVNDLKAVWTTFTKILSHKGAGQLHYIEAQWMELCTVKSWKRTSFRQPEHWRVMGGSISMTTIKNIPPRQ